MSLEIWNAPMVVSLNLKKKNIIKSELTNHRKQLKNGGTNHF
jgi:hypothetical protein